MADRVKSIKQLKIVAGFVDGDDRTITIDTTRNGNWVGWSAQVKAFATVAAPVLIGDKASAAFKNVKSAKHVTQTTTYLDLTTA